MVPPCRAGLSKACSPSVPGTPSPIKRPRWPRGRCLSPPLCSLLQVSQARAAGGRCDDTLGSLGANAATVRHNRFIASRFSAGGTPGADFSCSNGDFSGSGEGIRTPGSRRGPLALVGGRRGDGGFGSAGPGPGPSVCMWHALVCDMPWSVTLALRASPAASDG